MQKITYFFDNNLSVFQSDNPLVIVLDIVLYIFLVIQLWNIPLMIAFGGDTTREIFTILKFIGLILIPLKMLLSLNTAIYNQGMVQVQREKIVKHYFRRTFLYDCLTVFAFVNQDLSYLSVFIIL